MNKTIQTLFFIAAFSLISCQGHKHEHTHENDTTHEHKHDLDHEHTNAEGSHESEGEESNFYFGLDDTYDNVHNGARLILAYDAEKKEFTGVVGNTTAEVLNNVRVEVHLSNGNELGPTTPMDLKENQREQIKIDASGETFEQWNAHPEVGNSEHGHSHEGGEHNHEHN